MLATSHLRHYVAQIAKNCKNGWLCQPFSHSSIQPLNKVTLSYMTNLLHFPTLLLSSILSLSVVAETGPQPIPAIQSDLAKQRLLTDITLINDKIVTVGERGHILISSDGETWQQANVPVSVLLTSVAFVSETTGYAVGHDAVILKTTDGGLNWTLVNYQPELDRPLLSVSGAADQIVAVGAYGLYYESRDGGETWTSLFQDELLREDDRLYLQDIKEFEPENYERERQYLLPHFNDLLIKGDTWYMAGEAGFLAKSINQGKDWQRLEIDYYGSFFAVEKAKSDEQQLIVAGLRGNLFVEQGEDWSGETLPGKATLNDVLLNNEQMFLFGNSGNLYMGKVNQALKHHVFDDGKAVMSGVVLKDKLVLATEAGVKTMLISEIK